VVARGRRSYGAVTGAAAAGYVAASGAGMRMRPLQVTRTRLLFVDESLESAQTSFQIVLLFE